MAIIALKAWYLKQYEPIKKVIQRPHDLRLSRNSLLKSGLRADFLDDIQDVETSVWFRRYLEGETVEFYIEGSGGYAISNIDLISHEIYFTKQDITNWLDPVIFFSHQTEYNPASEIVRSTLDKTITDFNKRSPVPLTLEISPRSKDSPLKLSKTQLRYIRRSLLFIADGTPVTRVREENQSSLLPNPNVCVEIGYALQSKSAGQILLVKMERPDLEGQYPFNLPQHQQLGFKTESDLAQTLPGLLDTLLQKFNLFS